jgi:hypothetical protein
MELISMPIPSDEGIPSLEDLLGDIGGNSRRKRITLAGLSGSFAA